ncbi:hypothetical protein ACXJY6_10125 [Vibrio sp. RC27]
MKGLSMRRVLADNLSMLKFKYKNLNRTDLSHSGIQRSGTNYLCQLLKQTSINVSNAYDPYRNHPAHKHFRLMDDKSSIFMDRESFLNYYQVNSIHELNYLCKYPDDHPHIVLFKTPESWLESVYSWGKKQDWSSLSDPDWKEKYLLEWDQYYKKWSELEQKNPELVLILCYESLQLEPQRVIDKICDHFHFDKVTLPNNGKIDSVRCSPKNREKHTLQTEEIQEVLNSLEFDWKKYQ